jgi:ABC-type sugar transport system permease subunit
MLKNVFLIALLFRSLDAIRVFDLFYAFGQRSSPSMASQSYFLMFAGTASDFAPGLAGAVIIFIFGIVISLIFVSLMRGVAQQN